MEQNLTPLCDIDPMLDDITVVARCISKWKPHTFGKPSDVWSLDFVLQDAQGNRVHCTCKKDHINKFQLLIDEGSCYRIRNFGVGENGGNYPLLSHRYKLNLYKNSSVTRLASFNNNVRGFKFEPFPNLYLKQFSESESVDVIGTIVSISDLIPFTKYGKEKKRRNLIIEDVEGIQLQCCFFDAWASKFDKLHDQREKVGHVVMILQLAKVSYFGDKPSVTNAMWGSKLYMNDDIPEINSFRQMYEGKDGYDPAKHSISVFSSAKKELTSEDFFKGAVKKMQYNCIVYAKIHKIHREHGWAYLACKRCGCKATEIEKKQTSSSSSKFKKQQTWNCKKHKEITAVGMKMKVIVRVIDDTGSASLVMFDDMIAKLCGVDCYGLIKEYGPEVDDYFPAELNTLIGKKMLFRFEYTEFNVTNNNHVYQIKLISDEETMISYFKKDFMIEDVGDDVQTPQVTATNISKFKNVENIPFNIEETPTSVKGSQSSSGETAIQASGGDTSSSGSGKRSFIDLDTYEEVDEAKKSKLVEVKIEPEE
ncbi:replication protein A 70 kDa DNA-binding subunit B [Artemisia annua]|uniref:Replication protein A 70 kDa DNA-binding subunit B n=1 Tax=Artemisia annua TaxID=35608 RepID=A0A2U1N613_ARTAN|nr:replication protein A 70 kDa DNA-binding subunit B [Artemisia annua]